MNKYLRLGSFLLAAAMIAGSSGVAFAQSADTSVTVTAGVVGDCVNLQTTGNITFPNYDVFNPNPTEATDTIEFQCTEGLTPSLTVNDGVNSGNCGGDRCMSDGTDYLDYQLYQDNAFSNPWPYNTAVAEATSTSDGYEFYPLNGEIPAGQNVEINTYTDTVEVTLSW